MNPIELSASTRYRTTTNSHTFYTFTHSRQSDSLHTNDDNLPSGQPNCRHELRWIRSPCYPLLLPASPSERGYSLWTYNSLEIFFLWTTCDNTPLFNQTHNTCNFGNFFPSRITSDPSLILDFSLSHFQLFHTGSLLLRLPSSLRCFIFSSLSSLP